MTTGNGHKIVVPLISLYDYMTHPLYSDFKSCIESRISNAGKKSNYKKFAKRMEKAIKYLPKELEVVVRVERKERRKI
jgi:hypothetical protein